RKRLPEKFILYQNYPNPFNSSTTIPYHLNIPGDVELSIYDITGRELLRIVKKKQQPGSDTVRLDMSDYSSGLYLYQLRVGKNSQTKKFLFIQ
ncbi:MAG: T9SS type A sorting domain-containing protein, partial [Aliifodinibius sp.]|nr:T9SS type A sorting domain-containing protein [Fodinibius sp.]NIV15985.1 T9SS type A sorting domain-containing protein [Fodinibius sp.]NIY29952.1 T9SS type A sorting domain-containing protein [Fodinibius sp.]